MFGIYEKALAPGSWTEMLTSARQAGYEFMEISIDESEERLKRVTDGPDALEPLREAIQRTGIRVPSMCLSAHRRWGLGSADPDTRQFAQTLSRQAIEAADRTGIRVIQIAGYYAYYEQPDPAARDRYLDGLEIATRIAQRYGVMLAIENIDTKDMATIHEARRTADEIHSPWMTVYPDIGNVVVNDEDPLDDLTALRHGAVGLHLKDTRPGEPRRVAFGTGKVPFRKIFTELKKMDFQGPYLIEMWNDDATTANVAAAEALRWVRGVMEEAAA